jgi:4-amino-4-deoxy-L-arabinose transferase-like glycosyltransferase
MMKKLQIFFAELLQNRSLMLILAISLVLRSIIAFLLPPGFDEAYYFLYTLNPDWSYFDHPPLVALTTGMGIELLGGDISQFSIRLGSVLFYTITLLLLYLCGKRLFSNRVGLLAVAIAAIAPIFHIAFGAMTLPDSPLMLFWVASLYVAISEFFPTSANGERLTTYKPTRKLAILGVLVGLACLGKYHGFFLGAGYVGFCLTSAKHRKALISPWALISLGLFLLTLFPLLYWNYQHDWASFTFQAERGVPAKQFDLARFGKALGLEMLFLFPTIGVPLLWVNLKRLIEQVRSPLIKRILHRDQDQLRQRRLILWVSAPVFIGFSLMGGYRQIFPTWAMPGFFTATLLLAEQAAQWRARSVKRWLIGSTIVINLLLAIALSHFVLGTFQTPSQYQIAALMPAQAREDGSIELIDILQLRRGFARSPQLMQALAQSNFVYTNRFHLSGHVGMALTPLDRKPITCFDKRDMRGFAFWSTAEQWVGKTGLYLTTDRFQTEENSAVEYQPYFQQFTKIGAVPLFRGGVEVDRIHVFQGKNLLTPFPRPDRATKGA